MLKNLYIYLDKKNYLTRRGKIRIKKLTLDFNNYYDYEILKVLIIKDKENLFLLIKRFFRKEMICLIL